MQLALCARLGHPFLGLHTERANVLYVSLELAAGMIRERIEALCRSLDLPAPTIGEGFHLVAPTAAYVPYLDLGAEDGMGWTHLRDLIGESGAQLVVLDTLYRFLPGLDPNDNREMGHVFGNLNALAQETGAGLLILDHVSKGESTGPVSHSALGASERAALPGWWRT